MSRALRSPLPWLAALAVAAVLVYLPGLGGGFAFDDYPNIVDNPALHVHWSSSLADWIAAVFSSPASVLQRPLAMLTFALNHAATGLDARWMKATGLAIHLANGVLAFGLVRALLRATPAPAPVATRAALWVCAAWVLAPINFNGVLYVVQRMETLCHTFVLAGLWAYVAGRVRMRDRRGGAWLALAGVAGGTLLGLASKESAALLPLYALCLEWGLFRFDTGHARRDAWLARASLAAVALLLVAVLAWAWPALLDPKPYPGRDFNAVQRLLTEARVVVDYARWTLLPDPGALSLYHDDYVLSTGLLAPASTLASIALLAATVLALPWLRTRRPLAALGIAWFLCAQLLTATVIPLELVHEHRNYFASLGLLLAVADLLALTRDGAKRVAWWIAIALLLAWTAVTALRAREAADPLRFASTEAAKHPRSPRATYDLARKLVILSDFDAASPYYRPAMEALQRATAVPGANILPDAATLMLAARARQPLPAQAWTRMQDKLRTQAWSPANAAALGSLLDCRIVGKCRFPREAMLPAFLAALERGANPELLHLYGNYALNVLGDPNLALQLWQDAAAQAPGEVQYQVSLARLLIAGGRPAQAACHIDRIERLGRLGQYRPVAATLRQAAGPAARCPSRN